MTKIDIFSGFLGAGKTTLIKKLISEAYKGEKLVLIENEFGEIGVDGGFLKESGVEINEMNYGCICCSLVGDFSEALKKVIEEYSPDRILIEPSGVGKLSDVIKAVQTAQGHGADINCACTVADAGKCKMYMKNFGEFFNDQIENAKTIILSRTTGIKAEKLADCLALIKEKNPKATIITTPWETLDGAKILEAMESSPSLEDILHDMEKELHEHHHHDHEHHDHDHHDHDHDHDHDHHDHDENCTCGCHDHHDHDHDHHDHDHEHDHHDHDENCTCGCHDHHDHDHDHHDHDHDHHHDHEHEHHDHDHHDHDHHDHDHHDHDHHDHDHDHHDHEHHHDHDHHDHDENCTCGCHDHHHHHADEVFESFGVETAKVFTKTEIENALHELENSEKYGMVLRAKGIVNGGNVWIHFDYTPEEPNVREGGAEVTGRICVIGSKLNKSAVAQLFGV